jgi:hypothetical protein
MRFHAMLLWSCMSCATSRRWVLRCAYHARRDLRSSHSRRAHSLEIAWFPAQFRPSALLAGLRSAVAPEPSAAGAQARNVATKLRAELAAFTATVHRRIHNLLSRFLWRENRLRAGRQKSRPRPLTSTNELRVSGIHYIPIQIFCQAPFPSPYHKAPKACVLAGVVMVYYSQINASDSPRHAAF